MLRVLLDYGLLPASRLVEISHAKGAPWDVIVKKARAGVAFGLQIPDDVIKKHFRYHKVPIGTIPNIGEPNEDKPFV